MSMTSSRVILWQLFRTVLVEKQREVMNMCAYMRRQL